MTYDYDTVYRYNETKFTGIPIARLHKDIWYWPDYEDAKDFATHFALPTERIIPYRKGWAIQLRASGPYVEAPRAT